MKKTIVGIMTIVAMVVAILGTKVNAATVSADKSEFKKGDIITVKVTTDTAMKSVQYNLGYNPEFVKPVVESDGKIAVAVDTGLASRGASDKGTYVLVSAFGDAGKSTSVKFEAIKDTEAASFTVSATEFSADGQNTTEEAFANSSVDVKIGDAEVEEPTPTPTDVPSTTDTPAPTEAPKATEKPSNGVKYPQTGAPVYAYVAGIALVAIVAGAVLAIRKNK